MAELADAPPQAMTTPHSVLQLFGDMTQALAAAELESSAVGGRPFDIENVAAGMAILVTKMALYQPHWLAKVWDAYCTDLAATGKFSSKEEAMIAGARGALDMAQQVPWQLIVPAVEAPAHRHLPEVGEVLHDHAR